MADGTKIEWADATWPVVQGCDYESPGCTNCYAVPLIWRMAHHPNPKISAQLGGLVKKQANGKLAWTGKIALREDRLDWPLTWPDGRRIFVPSHGDLFHPGVPRWFQDRVFAVMAFCERQTFILLTKRPGALRAYLQGAIATRRLLPLGPGESPGGIILNGPLPNLWLGFSAEDQQRLAERWKDAGLLAEQGWRSWCSAEPLLRPLDLTRVEIIPDTARRAGIHVNILTGEHHESGITAPDYKLSWLVVGGESGPGARPMHPDWARSLRDQCASAGVPFFFKQWGEWARYRPQPGGDLGGDVRAGRVTIVHPIGQSEVEVSRVTGGRNTIPGSVYMARVGKPRAGRLLDGVEHNEFPA